MKVLIECTYCGHRVSTSVPMEECEKCKDKNLKLRRLRFGDVYGYGEIEIDKEAIKEKKDESGI